MTKQLNESVEPASVPHGVATGKIGEDAGNRDRRDGDDHRGPVRDRPGPCCARLSARSLGAPRTGLNLPVSARARGLRRYHRPAAPSTSGLGHHPFGWLHGFESRWGHFPLDPRSTE